MNLTPQEYRQLCKQAGPRSPLAKDCLWAFLTGGSICLLGEVLRQSYLAAGLSAEQAGMGVSVTLICLSALTTGLGWYRRLAARAGAGTLVPITGFANAVVSPAIEFRAEGLVTGVAARMFTVAGPVLVYGIAASAVYGLVVYLLG